MLREKIKNRFIADIKNNISPAFINEVGVLTSMMESRDHFSGDSFLRNNLTGSDIYLTGARLVDYDIISLSSLIFNIDVLNLNVVDLIKPYFVSNSFTKEVVKNPGNERIFESFLSSLNYKVHMKWEISKDLKEIITSSYGRIVIECARETSPHILQYFRKIVLEEVFQGG